VLGGAILVFVMAVVFPPLLFGTGVVVSALMGWLLTTDAEARYEGTEWLKVE
jgi:hypothetical protein